MIKDPSSKERYRKNEKAFSRNRKLGFSNMILIMLRKSVKSLQNSLNEFFSQIDDNLTKLTASAYSQARKNLSHQIFIDINKAAILDNFYMEDEDYDTYKGHRVLSIDGSKIVLPESDDIRSEFGSIINKNQHGTLPEYSGALVSILYDVLNNLAIDSKLKHAHYSEKYIAEEHLDHCFHNDVIICDRGYASYKFFALILQKEAHFIVRCSNNYSNEVKEFLNSDSDDRTFVLKREYLSEDKRFPKELSVRFLKVFLDTGEVEILATSLLDTSKYPIGDFKNLYWMRWGIETYFGILKNRLNIENFTGKSSEAVKQDFYSTIMVSNYESIMTAEAQKELQAKENNKYDQKVNKAVSFNTIKNNVIELFLSNTDDLDDLFQKMDQLFLLNPSPIREKRTFERNTTDKKAVSFHKRQKKIVF